MATGSREIIQLKYKAPYDFGSLLKFYQMRALKGIEDVGEDFYRRTARVRGDDGALHTGLITVTQNKGERCLELEISNSLAPVKEEVVARVRRMFDVDRSPKKIAAGLAPLLEVAPAANVKAMVMPGCFDPFETTCRAILGQQISVTAANSLAARIVENYGPQISKYDADMEDKSTQISKRTVAGSGKDAEGPAPNRAWLTPAELLAIPNLEEAFGLLGVIRNRTAAIAEIARMLEEGQLDLSPTANPEEQIQHLLAIKGIGPWTANYIAMRALSYPDAFLEKDVGVIHALPESTPKERLAMAEAWRPYRSYAVIALWNSL